VLPTTETRTSRCARRDSPVRLRRPSRRPARHPATTRREHRRKPDECPPRPPHSTERDSERVRRCWRALPAGSIRGKPCQTNPPFRTRRNRHSPSYNTAVVAGLVLVAVCAVTGCLQPEDEISVALIEDYLGSHIPLIRRYIPESGTRSKGTVSIRIRVTAWLAVGNGKRI
jgi:hypothetical protein